MTGDHGLHRARLVQHERRVDSGESASSGFCDERWIRGRTDDVGHGPIPIVAVLRVTEVDLLEVGPVGFVSHVGHDPDHRHLTPTRSERLANRIPIAIDLCRERTIDEANLIGVPPIVACKRPTGHERNTKCVEVFSFDDSDLRALPLLFAGIVDPRVSPLVIVTVRRQP